MSSEIVQNFKVAHQSIVDSIDGIQPFLRSYLAAKPKIREMKEKLLFHLGKQNSDLFDQLRSWHEHDREATKIIEFLTHDLNDIKIKYLIFFEKYSGELADKGSSNFPLDFTEFSKAVLDRLKVEEEYLLPLLKKISDSAFE